MALPRKMLPKQLVSNFYDKNHTLSTYYVSIIFKILLLQIVFTTLFYSNILEVTAADIRLDPTYMLYYTISQIFHPTLTTGIAPMVALIFMNTSIFFGNSNIKNNYFEFMCYFN